MRTVLAVIAAVVIVACSGTSTDSADSAAGTTTTETGGPTVTTTDASSVIQRDGAVAYDEAVAAFGPESPEATVAGFAAFTGPLPSIPDVGRSTELYPSFSGLFEQYPDVAEEIDPADREAIDERLDELFQADFVIDLGDLADSGGPEQPEGIRAASPPTTLRVLDDDDVDDSDRGDWTSEMLLVWGQLNDLLPAPNSLDVVILVSTPSFWTLAGAGDGPEPGAGTVRSEFVDEYPAFAPLRERYGDHDCYIAIARDRDARPTSGIGKAVIAHELFHCWHSTRFSGRTAPFHGAGPWVYEGLAAWVGESIAGGTSYPNGRWLNSYAVNDFSLFTPTNVYAAYGFWARVDEFVDLWGLIPSLVDTSSRGSSAAVFEEAIAATGDNGVLIATGALQQAELGPAWVAGPWMPPSIARRPATHRAVVDGDAVELRVEAGGQAAHRVTVDAPDGSFVDVVMTGYSSLTWADGETWAAGADRFDVRYCVGDCGCPGFPPPPADGELPVGLSDLTIALGGTGSAAAEAVVEVIDRGECDDPGPSDEEIAGGLVGTWRANPESVALAFTQASGFGPEAEALDIAGVTGDVLMTFNDDGTGTLAYDAVTLFFNDAPFPELTLNGAGSFGWTSTAGAVSITGTSYAISVGSSALGGELTTITSDDIPAAGTTQLAVSFGGDQLSIDATGSIGQVFFPILWNRV